MLDADLYGPSMPRLFGLKGRPHASDDGAQLYPLERFGVKVMSIGFLVEDSAPIVWRGPMVMSALRQLLYDVAWGELDVLVVDMPPGTGDAQLTIAQAVPLAGAVIVSTPQDLALIDARRGVAMFQQVHVPLIGLIENMSYFVCPHCGGRSDVFAHGGARHEAEHLGVPFLGETPLHMTIRETSDNGEPLVATAPDSPQARAYIDIAQKVAATLAAGAPSAKRREEDNGRLISASKREETMAIEFQGKTIETTATGYLADQDDWSRELAEHLASLEKIELTQKHWDLIDYLREEYFDNNQSTPNTRTILKAMSDRWGERADQKTLYDLFPLDPSKQGGRIAGLPESRRKGGY